MLSVIEKGMSAHDMAPMAESIESKTTATGKTTPETRRNSTISSSMIIPLESNMKVEMSSCITCAMACSMAGPPST